MGRNKQAQERLGNSLTWNQLRLDSLSFLYSFSAMAVPDSLQVALYRREAFPLYSCLCRWKSSTHLRQSSPTADNHYDDELYEQSVLHAAVLRVAKFAHQGTGRCIAAGHTAVTSTVRGEQRPRVM